MKSVEEMISVNKEQAEFYDSIHIAERDVGHGGYSKNESANFFTRFWAGMRYRQQEAVKLAGIESQIKASHARWISTKAGGDFLEVGCFSGSPSTFMLAEAAGSYLGVELSSAAVVALNEKFGRMGLAGKAKSISLDFLTMEDDRKFDLIYAHGVLHHFENPKPLFKKLAQLCKPRGVLLFVDPSAVNRLYRTIRYLYRPFQSDAAWEWPFQHHTLAALNEHFLPVEGFGWGRFSLPLSVLTGMPGVGSLLRNLYVRTANSEVAAGWHKNVWKNSMVTAMFQVRDL